MRTTAGIDVGSGAVKAVVMKVGESGEELLSRITSKIRKRTIEQVVDEVFRRAVEEAGVDQLDYVATTGEGEEIAFATGHFYGMTTHARGALFLEPRARFVLDVGALHARAIAMSGEGRVTGYKMTSQCASGSGQFLENIARYLGIAQAEIGQLSQRGRNPEKVSSICAVLAETDVINMVSRGISPEDILRGIHESMAGRFARLLQALGAGGVVFLSGGLAGDTGLVATLDDALAGRIKGGLSKKGPAEPVDLVTSPDSIYAGAIGAAIWGAFRHGKLGLETAAWKANEATSSSAA